MLDHLPSLADTFVCGELSIEKLKAIYHRASRGYRDALVDLDGVLAEDAMLLGDNSFTEELDRHLMPFEPDVADDGDLVDPARRVVVRRRAGGMASLIAACTAEEAIRAKAQLDEMAPDDHAGQVNAVLDAVAEANAATGNETSVPGSATSPAEQPKRAWTELVVDLPTVMGLSTNPGYLLGYDRSIVNSRGRWRVDRGGRAW